MNLLAVPLDGSLILLNLLLICLILLLFLTLWFHPGGSFMAGLIGAVVLSVAGWFALKSKPKAH